MEDILKELYKTILTRKDIGEDKMRNIIGHVDKSHLGILDLIGGSDRLVINRIKK